MPGVSTIAVNCASALPLSRTSSASTARQSSGCEGPDRRMRRPLPVHGATGCHGVRRRRRRVCGIGTTTTTTESDNAAHQRRGRVTVAILSSPRPAAGWTMHSAPSTHRCQPVTSAWAGHDGHSLPRDRVSSGLERRRARGRLLDDRCGRGGRGAGAPRTTRGILAFVTVSVFVSLYLPFTLTGPDGAAVIVQPERMLDVNVAPSCGIFSFLSSTSRRASRCPSS